jgi:hypothetical protein
MKKGFTQTLMMTAILVMAAQAMAMAPIIGEIPSPVVGDQETATPINTFVYPDAIDLTTYVTDKETTANLIVWSYEVSGTQIYKINGDPPLAPTDDPVAPPAEKVIAGPGAVDNDLGNSNTSHTQDSTPNTITIRNIALSPIGGPNTALAAGTMMPQDVTLYASDGDTVGIKTITFFTNKGKDWLSFTGIVCVDRKLGNGTTGTSSGFSFTSGTGHITSSVTGKGICMTVGNAGQDALAYWESSTFGGNIPLVKNNAYRIRMVMNGTQVAASQVPLWDLLITNYMPQTGQGLDLYGAEFWMFDTAGSLNGSAQFTKGDGTATFDFWWTPPPVLTDRWNSTDPVKTGPYATVNAANRDAFVLFRVIDSKATRLDLHPGSAIGSLCLQEFEVTRYDLTEPGILQVDPNDPAHGVVWQKNSAWALAPPAPNVAVNSVHFEVNGNVEADFDPAGAFVTLKAFLGSGPSADCYAQLAPGDNYGYNQGDFFDEPNIVDNFPCPFDAHTLYKVTYMLCAPSQGDEDNPVDALYLGGNNFNSEEIQEGYVDTHNWHRGLPAYIVTVNGVTQPNATPQPFVSFFYTNYGQDPVSNPAYWGWRPTLSITNNHAFIASGEVKTGAIKLSSIKVEKITEGMN